MCTELLLLFVVTPIWLSAVWLKFNSTDVELLPNAVVDAVVDVDVCVADNDGVAVNVNIELLLLRRRVLLERLLTVPAVELTEDVAPDVGITWKWIALFDSISLIAELQLPTIE